MNEQDYQLAELTVQKLLERHQLVATAESCTGGTLASWITEVSGSSAVFEMGEVTYANRIKHQQLNVKNETLDQFGAVSPQTAKEMALGLLKKSCADFTISITGIAGPTGGSAEKPVGTVYIGLAHQDTVRVDKLPSLPKKDMSRSEIRRLTCRYALEMLLQELE